MKKSKCNEEQTLKILKTQEEVYSYGKKGMIITLFVLAIGDILAGSLHELALSLINSDTKFVT